MNVPTVAVKYTPPDDYVNQLTATNNSVIDGKLRHNLSLGQIKYCIKVSGTTALLFI